MNSFLNRFILVLIMCGLAGQLQAQHAPKRELRGAWIATVANIDWPSKPALSVDSQKEEYIRLLDKLKSIGMNAVIVQVRPAADAFYNSAIEPWSYWLTGQQGRPPIPYYDPLQFMIKEAHDRGMEFHAWFNPYRAMNDIRSGHIVPNGIMALHPEWFLVYGTKKYFNPGIPEVWNYLVRVIDDVVKRYDIDAVQFDDYFYPYRIAGKEFPDYSTYRKYGNGLSIDDWRRHNVDTIIQMLSANIKQNKPWVKFGISPFGIWRNRDRDLDGSFTKGGQTNYDDLYADVLLWLKKGWIDYVCPQLYWEFGNRYAAYEVLLDWWVHHSYGRQLYIGQAVYRIGSSAAWSDPGEMPDEIRANRTTDTVKGSIFFSASVFYKNPLGFDDSLKNDLYKYPALLPRMPWIDSIPPSAPELLGTISVPGGLLLQWKNKDTTATQAVIYRFNGDSAGDFNNPANILDIVNLTNPTDTGYLQVYPDQRYHTGQHYVYAVTSLDRLHNESAPGNFLYIPVRPDRDSTELYHVPFKESPAPKSTEGTVP